MVKEMVASDVKNYKLISDNELKLLMEF